MTVSIADSSRKTRVPRDTGVQPASISFSISYGMNPPSGPRAIVVGMFESAGSSG